jgi:hypothetical protein
MQIKEAFLIFLKVAQKLLSGTDPKTSISGVKII